MNSKDLFLHYLDSYFHSPELTTVNIFLCFYPEIAIDIQACIFTILNAKRLHYMFCSLLFLKLIIDLTDLSTSTHLYLLFKMIILNAYNLLNLSFL